MHGVRQVGPWKCIRGLVSGAKYVYSSYIPYGHFHRREANKNYYVPFVYLSVFWAVAIQMVTALLLAVLPARSFWNSSLMGPRFLASAFAAGSAFMILVLAFVQNCSSYEIRGSTMRKLAMITAVAGQINLVMLGSEVFKEFYHGTHHSLSAHYLFFGLDGHYALVPWTWTSIGLNLLATAMLTIHPIRR